MEPVQPRPVAAPAHPIAPRGLGHRRDMHRAQAQSDLAVLPSAPGRQRQQRMRIGLHAASRQVPSRPVDFEWTSAHEGTSWTLYYACRLAKFELGGTTAGRGFAARGGRTRSNASIYKRAQVSHEKLRRTWGRARAAMVARRSGSW
jgi:hypothetical protein